MGSKKFVLSDKIKVRKEDFGAIVLIKQRKSTRFYNQFAYQCFLALRQATTVDQLVEQVKLNYDISGVEKKDIESFIQKLADNDICVETDIDSTTKAEFYYTDVSAFQPDFFYAPVGVEIEYTNKCARQCEYCSYYSNPFVDVNQEKPVEEWKQVIEELVHSGVYYVRFTGGDPFMRKDILEAVKHADELGLMVSIGTDLTVTKEEDFVALSQLKNFVAVQTTMDGATQETCERYRGKGNFQKVLKGMELMQKHDVPFIVGTVLTRHNVHEIEDIGRLVSKYGTKGYCFSPLYLAGRGIGLEDDLPSNEDLYSANKQFKKLIDEHVILPADAAWSEISNDLDEDEFKNMLNDQSHLTRTGERLIRIDPKGNCYVSVKLKRVLVENEQEWKAGNIKDTSLIDIWQNSAEFKKWRNIDQGQNAFGKTIDMRELLTHQ